MKNHMENQYQELLAELPNLQTLAQVETWEKKMTLIKPKPPKEVTESQEFKDAMVYILIQVQTRVIVGCKDREPS